MLFVILNASVGSLIFDLISVVEILRGVYTERSECAQNDSLGVFFYGLKLVLVLYP